MSFHIENTNNQDIFIINILSDFLIWIVKTFIYQSYLSHNFVEQLSRFREPCIFMYIFHITKSSMIVLDSKSTSDKKSL